MSPGGACLWPGWRPALRRRERGSGSCVERGNLSLRCKGRTPSGGPTRGRVPMRSTEAAGRRQTDRPTRAWRRTARLSTRSLKQNSRSISHGRHDPNGRERASVHSGPACLVFREFGPHLGLRNRHAQASFCAGRRLENLVRRRRAIFRGVRWRAAGANNAMISPVAGGREFLPASPISTQRSTKNLATSRKSWERGRS